MDAANLLCLDLEMNQPSGKIIEIGAVVGNIHTGAILEELSVFIDPGEPLTEFISQLTGITDYNVIGAPTLIEGYQKLKELHKKYNCFPNPLVWGGGDSQTLKEQLKIEYDKIIIGKTFEWPFGHRWLDVKTIFQFRQFKRHEKIQGGLAKALTKCGLQFHGKKHRAMDDARNTFLLAHELMYE